MMPSEARRRTRTAQPLDGPSRRLPVVQDPHDIPPWLVGPHASNGRQPGVKPLQNAGQMGSITARAHFADSVWVSGTQAGIAADAAAHACRVQAGFGALGDQRALELGDGTEHLQGEHALRRRGINRIAQATKMGPASLKLLDDAQQVADRAGKAVEPHHDQRFTGGDVAQQARQHRPAAVGAGGVLLEDCGATCSAEFVALRVGALFVGRDPRITDQTTCGGRFPAFGWHGGGGSLWWGDFTDQQGVCKRSFAGVPRNQGLSWWLEDLLAGAGN